MVATTKPEASDYAAECPLDLELAASANYCVAWRIRCNGTWYKQYFANRFEAHRRYLQIMTRASEVCLYVPAESP